MTNRSKRPRTVQSSTPKKQNNIHRIPKVNDSLEIWWNPMQRFYRGTLQPSEMQGTYRIEYDDGEIENEVTLAEEVWRFADEPGITYNKEGGEAQEVIEDEILDEDMREGEENDGLQTLEPNKESPSRVEQDLPSGSLVDKEVGIATSKEPRAHRGLNSEPNQTSTHPTTEPSERNTDLRSEKEELNDPTYEEVANMPKLSKKATVKPFKPKGKKISRAQTRASGSGSRKRLEKTPRASSLVAKKNISDQAAREAHITETDPTTSGHQQQKNASARLPVPKRVTFSNLNETKEQSNDVAIENDESDASSEDEIKPNIPVKPRSSSTPLTSGRSRSKKDSHPNSTDGSSKSKMMPARQLKNRVVDPSLIEGAEEDEEDDEDEITPVYKPVQTNLFQPPMRPFSRVNSRLGSKLREKAPQENSRSQHVSPSRGTSNTDRRIENENRGDVNDNNKTKNKFLSEVRGNPSSGTTTPRKITFKPATGQTDSLVLERNDKSGQVQKIPRGSSSASRARTERQAGEEREESSPPTRTRRIQRVPQSSAKTNSPRQKTKPQNADGRPGPSTIAPETRSVPLRTSTSKPTEASKSRAVKRTAPDSNETREDPNKKQRLDRSQEGGTRGKTQKEKTSSRNQQTNRPTPSSNQGNEDRSIAMRRSPETTAANRSTQLLLRAMEKMSHQVELNGKELNNVKQTVLSAHGETKKELGIAKLALAKMKQDQELSHLENDRAIKDLRIHVDAKFSSLSAETSRIAQDIKGFRAEIKKQLLEIRSDIYQLQSHQADHYHDFQAWSRSESRMVNDAPIPDGNSSRQALQSQPMPLPELTPTIDVENGTSPVNNRSSGSTETNRVGGGSRRAGSSRLPSRETEDRGRMNRRHSMPNNVEGDRRDHGRVNGDIQNVTMVGRGRSIGINRRIPGRRTEPRTNSHEDGVFKLHIKELIARQATVWLLETSHELEISETVPDWTKNTAKEAFRGVVQRLRLFADYTAAHNRLSTSLGNDRSGLDWFLRPDQETSFDRARRNYRAWEPQPTDEEWATERRLLQQIARAFADSFHGFTPVAGETQLNSAIRAAELTAGAVEQMDFS